MRVVAGAFGAAACGEPRGASEMANAVERPVCPACPASPAGGESSDFGGTPHPCTSVERKTAIDADTAAAFGFDVPELQRRVEREFDEPLRWMQQDTRGGVPPAGYEEQTRVEGRARIISYSHVSLDPEACDGTSCWIDGSELECSDRLELGIEAELRTLDGAIEATAIGFGLQGRPGFSFESPAGSVFADLREVRGTLQLALPADTAIELAVLSTDLFFKADRVEGDIHTYIRVSYGPVSSMLHYPLWGHWPDLPAR